MLAARAGLVVLLSAFSAAPVMLAAGWTPPGFFIAVLVLALVAPLPLPAVMGLSLCADVFSGAPLGAHGVVVLPLLLVLVRWGAALPRQPFATQCAALAALLLLAQWLAFLLGGGAGLTVAMQGWIAALPLVPTLLAMLRLVKHEGVG